MRSGRYGPFYGCSNFPECRYKNKISAEFSSEHFDESLEYGDETYEYMESQTLRGWNPSMKKPGRRKYYNYKDDGY